MGESMEEKEEGSWRIVCWNVNGLYNTLRDASHRYSSAHRYFTEILAGDVLCFQEAKIQEDKLEKSMACVPGYESFWAFSQEKKGYSGVVTYVKTELCPLDAKADWLGDADDDYDLCREGRLMYTDHGSFVLLNVYVPNGGDKSEGRPRLEFKLRFLRALENLCWDIVNSGKHILVVGDFNIAHRNIDVHKKWKIEEIYCEEERIWLDSFLNKFTDLYRYFHPDEREVYSVWNQKTEARIHNEGLRIDYAICDRGFTSEVLDVQIVKIFPKNWSDHAAVVVKLKQQPVLPKHPSPAIGSSNMKKFQEDQTQKKITSLFSRHMNKPETTRGEVRTSVTNEVSEKSVLETTQTQASMGNEILENQIIKPERGISKAPSTRSPVVTKRKMVEKIDSKQRSLRHFLKKD